MLKIPVYLTKLVLSTLIFSLIVFSLVSFDTKQSIKLLFSDIFEHSSTESKVNAIEKLNETCDIILSEDSENMGDPKSICENHELMKQSKKNCERYYESKENKATYPDIKTEEFCEDILSGKIDKMCKDMTQTVTLNQSLLNEICLKNSNSQFQDKEFFANFAITTVDNSYNNKIGKPEIISVVYPILIIGIILSMLLLYFLLDSDKKLFWYHFSRILLNLGISCILVFSLPRIILLVIGADSSFILQYFVADYASTNFVKEALPLMVIFLLSRLFGILFLVLGIVLIITGFIGSHILKKKIATE